MTVVSIFAIIICLAIFFVLMFGIFNLGNSNASQKFMRWRVLLQALAIIIVLLLIYWQGN